MSMKPSVIIHHSLCVGGAFGAENKHQSGRMDFIIHTDGTQTYTGSPPGDENDLLREIHITLIGYFNSRYPAGMVDSRQLEALFKLLCRLFGSREEISQRLTFHHRFCPGYRFPREELEWKLWNMFS